MGAIFGEWTTRVQNHGIGHTVRFHEKYLAIEPGTIFKIGKMAAIACYSTCTFFLRTMALPFKKQLRIKQSK